MKKLWILLLAAAICMACLCGCANVQEAASPSGELDLDYISTGEEAAEEEKEAEPWYAWIKNAFSFGSAARTEEKPTDKPDSVSDIYKQGEAPENPYAEKETDEEEEEEPKEEETENKEEEKKPWYQPIKDEKDEEKEPETEEKEPEPEPEPVEEKKTNTVTMHIRCDTAVNNGMHLESQWAGIVPASGIILDTTEFEIEEGDTVFDVLCQARDKFKLHMEYSGVGSGIYVEGINNLYEFDGGRWSGWMYCVNEWYPNYGCGVYYVQPGDVIEWNYTCDLGCDLENGDPYGYGKDWKENHD